MTPRSLLKCRSLRLSGSPDDLNDRDGSQNNRQRQQHKDDRYGHVATLLQRGRVHAAHSEHLRAAGKFVQRLEKLDLLADTSKDGLLSAIPQERLRSLNAAAALARQLLTLQGPLERELGISIVRHRYLQAANKPRRHVVYPAA
jgi:hypothetical protein